MGTCTNCGCSKIGCGCQDSFLTSPPPCPTPVDCPEAQPCAEVFDAQCIIYSGADIICTPDVVVATDTNVADALNNIVDYLCNAFANFSILIAKVSCGTDEVIPNNSTVQEAFIAVVEYICDNLSIATNVTCGTDIISPSGTPVVDVLQDIVDYFCVAAKEIYYHDHVETITLSTDPNFVNLTYFSPSTYPGFTYTNTSGVTKQYKVHASYCHDINDANLIQSSNWVDAAIIKTVLAVDTILYQNPSLYNIRGALYDGPLNSDIINSGSTNYVETNLGAHVEFRFGLNVIPANSSLFYLVTLNNNETVSLKFKTKSAEDSYLNRAQIMVEEF